MTHNTSCIYIYSLIILGGGIFGTLQVQAQTPTPPVLDFCVKKTPKSGTTYQKQNLLLFNMAGLEKVVAGEKILNEKGEETGTAKVLAKVNGDKQFEEVWNMTFPMRRFFNVISPESAPESFRTSASLQTSEIQKAFKGEYSEFLSRSAGCADYVAAPYLTTFEASWTKESVKKFKNGKEVTVIEHSLSINPTIEIFIFKRDGEGFTLHKKLTQESSGLFNFITDLGSATTSIAALGNQAAGEAFSNQLDQLTQRQGLLASQIKSLNLEIPSLKEGLSSLEGEALEAAKNLLTEQHQIIADLEDQRETIEALLNNPATAADSMARQQNKGWDGLVSGMPTNGGCTTDGPDEHYRCSDVNFWLPERSLGVAGMSERSSSACKVVDFEKMESVAPCEIRVRTENITLLSRESAQGVDGWRLFAPLQYTVRAGGEEETSGGGLLTGELAPGLSLGKNEGVRSGAIFWAVSQKDGQRERLGFARVVKAGPGGSGGRLDPSTLAWRAGNAKVGTRMEEHPQIGVSLTVGGAFHLGLAHSKDSLLQDLGSMPGISLDVGYNLTPYTTWYWGEMWLRTYLEVAFSNSSGVGVMVGDKQINELSYSLFNALAGPELKIYLLRRLDLVLTAAGGISSFSLSTPDNEIKTEDDEELRDDSGGGASLGSLLLGVGLDIILHPDWLIRTGFSYRQNLQEITLEPPEDIVEGSSIFSGQNAGSLSGASVRTGLIYIY